MERENVYIKKMNDSIKRLFWNAFKLSLRSPRMAIFLLKAFKRQWLLKSIRLKYSVEGISVPPFAIASITHSCNLKCKGCYAMEHRITKGSELSDEKLKDIFSQAKDLGISVILIAGGEPLTRMSILEITKVYPEIIFPVFTNGLLINDQVIGKFVRQRNVVPVISIEGYAEDTDNRRGNGVYNRLDKVFKSLKASRIFYGISLTVTRMNFETITGYEFVEKMMDFGCKVLFYVEYVPVEEGTEDNVITGEQRLRLLEQMDILRSRFSALFITFPGDEEEFGGCMSAGRGFVHISPEGALEPCPFAPYSDVNLNNMPLKEALNSDFLKEIRLNHNLLQETSKGCALWDKREWVQTLLK